MKKITANVFTEDQMSVPPRYRGSNPSFVTTSEGIVMIDTPMMPTDAVKWRDDVAKKGEVGYIINTHHHIDHTMGNSFFPGTVVSHEGVRKMFSASAERIIGSDRLKDVDKSYPGMVGYHRLLVSEHDPEGMALLDGYQLRPPTVTFNKKLSLYVGGHTFELFHQPGHTQSHIGVYIPEEKVFFTGDNFCNATQPSLAHSLPLDWVNSLKQIETLDIDAVVPGHGQVGDKKAVHEFRLFIEKCIDMVRGAIKKGMSKEEAADKISFEKFYPPVHPGTGMQRRNVLHLYEVLSKEDR